MNRIALAFAIVVCSMTYANADTYTWTDDKGVVNFTDDSTRIPSKYSRKAKRSEDITIRNPKVQQELREQDERARQDGINRPRIVLTPDSIPSPQQPPAIIQPRPASDDLPPGRTKSQRIRDNIERREAEEKGKQVKENTY